VKVVVTNRTHPTLEANEAMQLDELQIEIVMPMKDVAWMSTGMVVDRNQTLGVTALWASARGRVYPTDISVPPGI
jgi:hypothetical protein